MIVLPPIFNAGDVLYLPFDTYNADGASVTITGLALADIKVFKNGSVTQRTSTAGFTLLDTDGIDFDGITGLHGFSIDTSDNTDAGFWTDGSQYWIVVDAITGRPQQAENWTCPQAVKPVWIGQTSAAQQHQSPSVEQPACPSHPPA
jgi:hypothetical protein